MKISTPPPATIILPINNYCIFSLGEMAAILSVRELRARERNGVKMWYEILTVFGGFFLLARFRRIE